MVPIAALVVPILVSAVLVFLASFILHTVIPWHRGDLSGVADEEGFRRAVRGFAIPPGDYIVPFIGRGSHSDPAFLAKMEEGPVMFLTVRPSGPPTMGKPLALWFLYTLLVGLLAALVAGPMMRPGEPGHEVFHAVALTSFGGYAMALMQQSIWWAKKWSATIKSMIDGVVYAVITGLTFAWLWPAM